MSALPKPRLAALSALLALLAAGRVAAQTGSGGTPGTVPPSLRWSSDFIPSLQYYDPAQKIWLDMSATQQQFFFNRARCECDADQTNLSGSFRVAIQSAQNTSDKIRQLLNQSGIGAGTVRLYAGGDLVNCLNPRSAIGDSYSAFCLNLVDPNDPNAEVAGGMAAVAAVRVWYSNPIPAAWLFNAVAIPVCSGGSCDSTTNCASVSAPANIYFWARTWEGTTPDMQDSFFSVNLVSQCAFQPENVTAEGSDQTLTVNWSWPAGSSPGGNASFLGVQLFCERADVQVFPSGTFAPAFTTAAMLCPGVGPAPAGDLAFANLAPSFLCSGLLPATATSHRITALQNGATYGVGVAAVDKWGNLSLIGPGDVVYGSPVGSGTSLPAASDGGQGNHAGFAKGCACAVASPHAGRRTAGSFALLLAFAMLPLSRARRPKR